MSQAEINADVTAIAGALTAIQGTLGDVSAQAATLLTDVTNIQAVIAAGGTVDTSQLDALVQTANALQTQASSAQAALDPAVTAVTALAPPAALRCRFARHGAPDRVLGRDAS
jgi:hypothetical protein